MTVMTTTQRHDCVYMCVSVCVCLLCRESLLESDNRTVILVKPPAQPWSAPHIFHLTMFTHIASFSPRLLFLLRGDEEWGSIHLYRTEQRFFFLSFPPRLLSFIHLRNPPSFSVAYLTFFNCQTLYFFTLFLSFFLFPFFFLSFFLFSFFPSFFLFSLFSFFLWCFGRISDIIDLEDNKTLEVLSYIN